MSGIAISQIDLRAEAEKLAAQLFDCGLKQCEVCQHNIAVTTDAILAFAQEYGARERLKGRIEGYNITGAQWSEARTELAVLESKS